VSAAAQAGWGAKAARGENRRPQASDGGMDASERLRLKLAALPRMVAPAPPRDAGMTTLLHRLCADAADGAGCVPAGLSSILTFAGCGAAACSTIGA
jgi:hypothetical protein